MYTSDDIMEGARAIRPYLGELLGAEGEQVDSALADLLEGGRLGKKVDNLILEVLRLHERTRVWMVGYLDNKVPPEVEALRSYTPVPGKGEPIRVWKYACPEGDYTWYRQSVREPVRECPTHHVLLVPAE